MKRTLLAIFLFMSCTVLAEKSTVSILIDPGHGGKDPGHMPSDDSGLQEKELALEISLKIGNYLTHNLSNVEVGYTRTSDIYPTLDERVELANDGHYDFMLSIHINGNPKAEICGTETHIHGYKSKSAFKWAKLIEQQFKKRAGRKSRGVKTAEDLGHSLQILKFTKIPSVLVECGFITNGSEAKYLNTSYGQEIIASAIFRATRAFITSAYPDIDFTPAPPEEIEEEEEEEEDVAQVETDSTAVEISVPHYKVQIMASIDPVQNDVPEFKKINHPVERVEIVSQSAYKYRYFVGSFDTKKEAKVLQKEVQSLGFEDAFITYQ